MRRRLGALAALVILIPIMPFAFLMLLFEFLSIVFDYANVFMHWCFDHRWVTKQFMNAAERASNFISGEKT